MTIPGPGIIILQSLYLPLFFGLLFSVGSCDKESISTRDNSTVVLYCSVDQEIAEPIIAEFSRQSGLKVKARYDTEAGKTVGLVQKIRAEANHPLADVFWSSEIFHTILLARAGLLASYHDEQSQTWPAKYKDPHGRWYAFALRGRVIAYRTDKIAKDQAPTLLEQVLEEKWKNRLVMANPRFGTTGGDIASWLCHYGESRTREILQRLKANGIRLVDGNSTAVRMVASGQADLCFTDTDDVYAAQRNGWSVAMNPLDQNGAGALAIPNTAAIIRGCPHPQAAQKLMKYLLDKKVERELALSDSHNCPIHPSIAKEFTQFILKHPLQIDYEKIADNLPLAGKITQEILR